MEKETIRIAKLYGEDINRCRFAAIAHDSSKNLKDNELIGMAKKYKIEIDKIQYSFPQLLHGPVAAMYCKYELGITDNGVINAIYFHTTGRENMSLIEKIIYIADITEEGRYFPGINIIKEKVDNNIDDAILHACNCSLSYILEKNFLIHPLTLELRNSILLNNGGEYEKW